jgi:hypothetical protein
MVEVSITRRPKPEPEPMPVRASDGMGRIVGCATCDKSRTVSREEIMAGTWTRCPACQSSEQGA